MTTLLGQCTSFHDGLAFPARTYQWANHIRPDWEKREEYGYCYATLYEDEDCSSEAMAVTPQLNLAS